MVAAANYDHRLAVEGQSTIPYMDLELRSCMVGKICLEAFPRCVAGISLELTTLYDKEDARGIAMIQSPETFSSDHYVQSFRT